MQRVLSNAQRILFEVKILNHETRRLMLTWYSIEFLEEIFFLL
jgi:hypothetical protein